MIYKLSGPDEEKLAELLQSWNSNRCWKSWTFRVPVQEEEMTELDVEVGPATEDIQAMVQRMDDVRAIHVEITGENPHQGEVLGIAFDGEDFVCYMPLDVLKQDEAKPVREWLADSSVPKTLYDAHKVPASACLARDRAARRSVRYSPCRLCFGPDQSSQSLGELSRRHGQSAVPEDEEYSARVRSFAFRRWK